MVVPGGIVPRLGFALATLLHFASRGAAQVFPAASANCTAATSKTASWEIDSFTFDTDSRFNYGPGTAGTASFSIKNSVNGYKFDCVQGETQKKRSINHILVDGKLWYGCNVYCYGASRYPWEDNMPLNTSFHFDLATKQLSVTQDWTCGSGNNVTTFLGSGSTAISNLSCSPVPGGRPDQVACAPVSVTVKASNVTVIVPVGDDSDDEDPYSRPFTPSTAVPASKPQVLHSTAGCSKLSQSPSFAVSGMSVSDLGIRFSLTNNALNYTTRCSLGDIGLSSPIAERTWLNCSRYDSYHATYPYDGIYTEILYGGTTNENFLAVNQTWYCDDQDKSSPTVYSAYAESKLSIDCIESRSCNVAAFENQPVMAIVDRCLVKDITFSPTKLSNFKVSTERAAKDFTPHGYNCTDRSLGAHGKPVWEITNFSFNRTWNNEWAVPGFMDEAQFTYNNTATDSEWPGTTGEHSCYEQSSMVGPPFDGTRQLPCYNSLAFSPGFTFDYNTSTLSVYQEWKCDGIERGYSNSFDAQGTIKVPLNCKAFGNGTLCTTTPSKVTVPMANLTASLNNPQGFGPF